ncbi:hypothetical protein BELINDA_253 [Bacillus phage Belinda]|uniref:hypothetical protein n=1 Tax=Bacillus phage Belinda TaxID=1852564 RepID=UPI0007F0C615|nr:hypothetical protein BI039_gp125 [Bacillus phage Belinda]ANM46179.1 hypothetical protein BELINDA_253 [Bacillus phage Belinda]
MLRVITETDRQEALVEKEQEEYILESSRSGIGTIILNKGEILKHSWERKDSFVDYAQSLVDDKELKEMVDDDFSFVEVKFIYSYENYEKFLTDRGVTV